LPRKNDVDLPVAPLADLMRWWKSQRTKGLIIGGLAVAILGRPRTTRDVDGVVILPESKWESFLSAGAKFGFIARIPDALAFAREARVLLVRHDASGIEVDISLGLLPFEAEAISRANTVEVGGVAIPVPTPEDLIVMKAIARRDRDFADIEGLLKAHPRLDLSRIRTWSRAFAEGLEMPEIVEDLERLIAEHHTGTTKKGRSKRKSK